jgi:hypothetical protein
MRLEMQFQFCSFDNKAIGQVIRLVRADQSFSFLSISNLRLERDA